ncbi:MAG: ATPase, T2SS/T4P/T4SS family [bacterium]
MINQKELEQILLQNKITDEAKLKEYNESAKKVGSTLEFFLLNQKIITADLLYETAAKFYNLPFIDLKDKVIRPDVLSIIPEVTAQAHQTVAFDQKDKELFIATLNISNLELFDFLKRKTGFELKLNLASPDSIDEAIKQYHKGLSIELEKINKDNTAENADKPQKLKDLAQDLPIVKIVDTMLEYAIFEKASDIHIEPEEKDVAIRYRIDGILRSVMTLPKNTHAGVVARLKILSNLKLDEHRLPQDGRFKIDRENTQVAFRVSILPTFDGEKIVLRLLPDQDQGLTLEQLGFQPQILEMVKKNIGKPNGMILVTGPTGSGKTTTLYTMLHILNRPEVNISTVEDPIEYRMPGVNQSQVQPKIGFTFASGLRALLRQDPNIIMVGEIRDQETAEISINAAMTGHLVLSTLHTNDAITAIPRLTDMQVPTFLISSTLNIIIAQRLVRKICKNCIESYQLDENSIKELERQFNLAEVSKSLTEKGLLVAGQDIKTVLFYRGKGCHQCGDSGYKGRLGIYEAFENNNKISELIIKKASREELEKIVLEQGMITMAIDGFIKAKNGITSIEEVLRVTRE